MKLIKDIKYKEKKYTYFSIYVNKKEGNGHSEVYRVNTHSLNKAIMRGFNKKAFFDYKKTKGNNSAGYYKVLDITYDNDKVYYRVSDGVYSLPKYFDKYAPKDYILVGERVYKEN